MKTTINLMDHEGKLLDLTNRVLAVESTLNNESILDKMAKPTGKAFNGGYNPGFMFKKAKRSTTVVAGATNVGVPASRTGYSTQWLGKVFIDKIIREDNIIGSLYDYQLLKEGKGGDLLALEVADFILGAKEQDLNDLYTQLSTQADAMKIYTAVTHVNAGDAYNIVPTGVQPAQADNKFATAITSIEGGKRSVTATDWQIGDNLMKLIRASLGYLNTIGSEKSVETFYPWSYNGIGLGKAIITADYKTIVNIKDSLTTTVVNLDNPGSVRNLNALVGFIDTVPVYISNQIGGKTGVRVHSNRVFVRDLDTTNNYIGVFKKNAGAVKLANGEVHNVGPDEILLQFFSPRRFGVVYFEESFEIKTSA